MKRRKFVVTAAGALATTYSGLATSWIVHSTAHGDDKTADPISQGLVGHWPLLGDVQDKSGMGNHGVAHGEGCERGQFDGRRNWVEIIECHLVNGN